MSEQEIADEFPRKPPAPEHAPDPARRPAETQAHEGFPSFPPLGEAACRRLSPQWSGLPGGQDLRGSLAAHSDPGTVPQAGHRMSKPATGSALAGSADRSPTRSTPSLVSPSDQQLDKTAPAGPEPPLRSGHPVPVLTDPVLVIAAASGHSTSWAREVSNGRTRAPVGLPRRAWLRWTGVPPDGKGRWRDRRSGKRPCRRRRRGRTMPRSLRSPGILSHAAVAAPSRPHRQRSAGGETTGALPRGWPVQTRKGSSRPERFA